MTTADIQCVRRSGPLDLWRKIAAEKETAHLLSSDAMRRRLLEAKERTGGIPVEDVRAQLGV